MPNLTNAERLQAIANDGHTYCTTCRNWPTRVHPAGDLTPPLACQNYAPRAESADGDSAYCAKATRYSDGTCNGWQVSEYDDEPTLRCKKCPRNVFYEGDEAAKEVAE